MTESWIDKDEKTIRDDIVGIAKEKTGLTNFKSTGVLRGIIEVITAVAFFIYKTAINPVYKNATLEKASGIFLSFWGLALGVARKQSVRAEGFFTGRSYGAGTIPEGSWIVAEGTELRYRVTEKTAFAGTSEFAVPVTAEFAGSSYNIGSEMPLRITRVVPGLDAVTVAEGWTVSPGQDSEEDDAYRERIKNRWRSQMLGDTKEVYRYYAEEVNGVREAKIIRTPRGPGSTDILIAAVNGEPDEDLIEAVRENLHAHELMAFDVRIRPPEIMPIDVEIEYSGDAEESAVRLVTENYIHKLPIGGRFAIRDLYEAYKPLNLNTAEILIPDRDMEAPDLYLITGDIRITRVADE